MRVFSSSFWWELKTYEAVDALHINHIMSPTKMSSKLTIEDSKIWIKYKLISELGPNMQKCRNTTQPFMEFS